MTLVKVPFDCACLPFQAYDVNILYKCLCQKCWKDDACLNMELNEKKQKMFPLASLHFYNVIMS